MLIVLNGIWSGGWRPSCRTVSIFKSLCSVSLDMYQEVRSCSFIFNKLFVVFHSELFFVLRDWYFSSKQSHLYLRINFLMIFESPFNVCLSESY